MQCIQTQYQISFYPMDYHGSINNIQRSGAIQFGTEGIISSFLSGILLLLFGHLSPDSIFSIYYRYTVFINNMYPFLMSFCQIYHGIGKFYSCLCGRHGT